MIAASRQNNMQTGANSNIFTACLASLSLLFFFFFGLAWLGCARTLLIFLPLTKSMLCGQLLRSCMGERGVCCLKARVKEEQREGLYCFHTTTIPA